MAGYFALYVVFVLRGRLLPAQFRRPADFWEYLQWTYRVQLRGVWFSRLCEHFQPRDPGSHIWSDSHAVVRRELRKVPRDHAISIHGAKPVVDPNHPTDTEKRAHEHGVCGYPVHIALTSN
jgi:hypothetical protein